MCYIFSIRLHPSTFTRWTLLSLAHTNSCAPPPPTEGYYPCSSFPPYIFVLRGKKDAVIFKLRVGGFSDYCQCVMLQWRPIRMLSPLVGSCGVGQCVISHHVIFLFQTNCKLLTFLMLSISICRFWSQVNSIRFASKNQIHEGTSPIKNGSHPFMSNHSLTFPTPTLNFANCGRYPRPYQIIFLWSCGSAPGWVSLILLSNELGNGGSLRVQCLR